MEFYAVLVFAFCAFGMVDMAEKKRWHSVIGSGLNVLMWSPFVGRALGWW